MVEISGVPSASLAFLWPAFAAASASEFASAMAKEFVNLAVGPDAEPIPPEPEWVTSNKVALELDSVRLPLDSTSFDLKHPGPEPLRKSLPASSKTSYYTEICIPLQ